MIEATHRPRPRSASIRAEPALIGFLRSLDWILMLAAAALVGYGLWVVSGITRFDVPGDEDYFVVRQAFAAGVGVAALVAAGARRWAIAGLLAGVATMTICRLSADPASTTISPSLA